MGLDNPLHIAFLVVILLLVFGAKRLPEIGRSLGSGMREFKDSITGGDRSESHHSQQPALPQGQPAQPPAQQQPAPVAQQQPVPVQQPAPPQQPVPPEQAAQQPQLPAEPTRQG
jgi:sec-independent protein translocase protein TatA